MPLTRGARWHYRARIGENGGAADVIGRVITPGRVRWRAVPDGPGRTTVWTVRARCTDEAAEEPWFGLLEGMFGTWSSVDPVAHLDHFEIDARRWRIPAVLAPRTTFGGEARVERSIENGTLAISFERSYRVVGRETIPLPDGHEVEASRLDFVEHQRAADRQADWTGAMWLAKGIGLVRMQLELPDHVLSWELVDSSLRP